AESSFDSVVATIWAALRCGKDEPSASALEAILPRIFEISGEERSGGWSDRRELYQELAFAARHGYADPAIVKLKELALRDERYADFVFRIFEEIDNPIALRFLIDRTAKTAAKPHKEGTVSGVFIWESQWRRGAGFEYRPMPDACINALEEMWAA